MRAGRYIYSKLTASSGLTALVGQRIYPIIAPQDVTLPFITYRVGNAPLDQTKDHAGYLDRASVEFRIWADYIEGQNAYEMIEDIDYQLREALDYESDTAGGVQVVSPEYRGSDDGDVIEDRVLFLKVARYELIIKN